MKYCYKMYNSQLLLLLWVPTYMEHIYFNSLLICETTALNKVNKTQKCVIINHFQHSYMTKQHLQIGFGYLNRGINIFVEAGHSFFSCRANLTGVFLMMSLGLINDLEWKVPIIHTAAHYLSKTQ